MGRRYESDEERRARNRGAIYHGQDSAFPPAPMALVSSPVDDLDKTPVTEISPIQRRRDTRNLAKGIALGTLAALLGILAAVLLGGCAPVQKPAPKLGASLLFPGAGSGSGSGGGLTNVELRASPVPVSGTVTANQGTAAAGSSAWPTSTVDTTNTVVKPGDSGNNAIRVNVVAGGAAGGTSSSFGAAIPGTGTAAGQSDGTNMQLPRVFDGDSGAGTQYVSGAVLRKVASGGTVEAGTSSDPLRVDPTGSTVQPVSGTVTITPSGTQTVAGNLTNNNAAPAGTLVGAMPAIANAAAPTWTEGRLVLASVDLGGSLRTLIMNSTLAVTQSGTWTVQPGNTANTTPWLVIGNQLSNGAAAASNAVPVLSAIGQQNSAATTVGRVVALSTDSDNGALRVSGPIEHDTPAASGNVVEPLLGGGYASAAAPTDVSADGDAVRAWFLRSGAQAMQPTYGGALASTGSGATGSGVLRVDLTNNGTGIINQGGTWTVQPGNTQNTTEWLTKPTPRTVSSANNTGTCTSVTTSSTTVLASNASRKAYGFKAPSTNTVAIFCKLGATATTAAVPFEAGSSWNQDQGAVYTGVIDCIAASSSSSICVYEFN